jgi:hypothetical protein
VTEPSGDVQARVDRLLIDLLAELDGAEAIYVAALLTNRAAAELHKRARAGANERRGTESWGTWAGLQNAARNLVLQSSTCRDSAAALAGRKR